MKQTSSSRRHRELVTKSTKAGQHQDNIAEQFAKYGDKEKNPKGSKTKEIHNSPGKIHTASSRSLHRILAGQKAMEGYI